MEFSLVLSVPILNIIFQYDVPKPIAQDTSCPGWSHIISRGPGPSRQLPGWEEGAAAWLEGQQSAESLSGAVHLSSGYTASGLSRQGRVWSWIYWVVNHTATAGTVWQVLISL